MGGNAASVYLVGGVLSNAWEAESGSGMFPGPQPALILGSRALFRSIVSLL